MNSTAGNVPLSDDDQRRIDFTIEAFESALKSGQSLRIEDFLGFVGEPLRPHLLAKLVPLDVRARREAGEVVSAADYVTRFPDQQSLVDDVFSVLAQAANTPTQSMVDSVSNASAAQDCQTVLVDSGPPETSLPNQTHDASQESRSADVPAEFGRYRIESVLGRGGMGAVYLAHDRQLDRRVALKIPSFEDRRDRESIDRFYREARAMATVHHANLCPVYDVGQFQDWHYLTMAFIDGDTLAARLKADGAFGLIEAIELLKKVAAALQKAHDAGIVHRDLKPSNIMITSDHEPIIMDFGLAQRKKAGEVEITHSGAVFGTPAYMAPEQVEARHDEIGPATDVYALGVILYQLLTGKRPFEGSAASVFGQIVSRVPDPPSLLRSDLPPLLDSVCLRAMSKQPEDRQKSAAEFAADLSRVPLSVSDQSLTASFRVGDSTQVRSSDLIPIQHVDPPSASRMRRDAELRQVTVAIFNYEADDSSLSDGSSISSHSEALHEQAGSFTTFVGERVRRLGGVTVASTGQEVTACFGFPQAFEDAAQRAVRAALNVRKELADESSSLKGLPAANQMWVTIHSGEAVAELIGPGSDAPLSLVGEARNVAARLNAAAEIGAITISPATRQRVGLYFQCESLGVQRVRGLGQPIELFMVNKEAASRNRVELVDPGNLTPLVGRDTELTILKDRWEQALDELGQIVLLIGDAGLGKSRLIRELREHVVRESDEDVAIIELRCSQYHLNAGFFPMVEFLNRLLELEHHTPGERLELVVRYLAGLKLDSRDNVALLSGLLGIPTDDRYPPLQLTPQKMRERTEELLLRWLAQLVEQRPVLFIVEDLHWVDPSTVQLLEKHVEQFERGRVLSILTFRPEFETPWRSKPHQTQIALNRLTKRQIGEMMRRRTGCKDIPEILLKQMIERTDGIPLFIEEFTAVVVESGVLSGESSDSRDSSLLDVIPATLHDLLLSRLDRIDADRTVIQRAATIGREFSFELLSGCVEVTAAELQKELDKLVKAEILFQKGQGEDAGYIFKHALLQDAAYSSMLTKKRQAGHQKLAEVMVASFPEITENQPALVAHHFTEAGVTDKAIEYWLKAGQRSQARSANLEAIQQLERGIELTMTLPPSPQRDQLELGLKLPLGAVLMGVKGYAAPEVEPVQNRCIEICRSLGEGAPLFPVLAANWEWLFIRGRFKDCEHRCQELIEIAEAVRGPGMMAEAYWPSNCTAFYAGDFVKTRQHAAIASEHHHREASIEFARITQQNSGPLNLAYYGMALWHLGYADQGFARLNEALRLCDDLKDVFTLQMVRWKISQTYDFAGIGDKAIEYGGLCRRVSEEQSLAFWIALGMASEGIGLKHLGRYDEAIETLRKALIQLESTGAFILFAKYRGHLADALWLSGDRDAGRKELEQAFADEHQGEYMMHGELLRMRGDFARDTGDLDSAAASYREAMAVAQRQGSKMHELRATLRLTELDQSRGQTATARELLQPLYNWFTEGFDMPDLKAARVLLESCR